MHDDDEFTEFANLQFERVTAGRYVVVGEVRVSGRLQTRRVECRNPAYGFAKLEEEIEDLLMAQVRAEAAAADIKRVMRRKRLSDV